MSKSGKVSVPDSVIMMSFVVIALIVMCTMLIEAAAAHDVHQSMATVINVFAEDSVVPNTDREYLSLQIVSTEEIQLHQISIKNARAFSPGDCINVVIHIGRVTGIRWNRFYERITRGAKEGC